MIPKPPHDDFENRVRYKKSGNSANGSEDGAAGAKTYYQLHQLFFSVFLITLDMEMERERAERWGTEKGKGEGYRGKRYTEPRVTGQPNITAGPVLGVVCADDLSGD